MGDNEMVCHDMEWTDMEWNDYVQEWYEDI